MDVACGRCHAEYEFDDALISAQGTHVRCTTCGHQFRVFPAEGIGQKESWTLKRGEGGREQVVYDSLRELQHAIGRGEVHPSDLLARGDSPPREVRSIAELAPLLSQPRSVPPPGRSGTSSPPGQGNSPSDSSSPGVGAGSPGAGRSRTGTMLGLAAPPVPRLELVGATPPPPDLTLQRADFRQRRAADSEDVVVPGSDDDAPEPALEAVRGEVRDSSRPRVFSVLSSVSQHAERAVFSPEEPGSPDSRAAPHGRGSRADRWGRLPDPARSPASEREPRPSPRTPRAKQLTPTPPLPSRVSAWDAEPTSRIPGTDRGRAARGALLLFVVLGGASVFLLVTAGDKLVFLTGSGVESVQAALEPEQKAQIERALDAQADAEEAWLRLRLRGAEEVGELSRALTGALQRLDGVVDELNGKELPQSQRSQLRILTVHLRRMQGDLPAARQAVGQAGMDDLPEPYALAMLDLADESEARPFAIILSRLKEASTGERGRFLVRSAYIYAQILSGRFEQAQSDLAALSQLKGGGEAPLFDDLERFLSLRRQAAEGELLGVAPDERANGQAESTDKAMNTKEGAGQPRR